MTRRDEFDSVTKILLELKEDAYREELVEELAGKLMEISFRDTPARKLAATVIDLGYRLARPRP